MRLIDADAPDLGHCKGGEVCGVVFVRLKDGGNVEEFAALKEKETGTDVYQQDD